MKAGFRHEVKVSELAVIPTRSRTAVLRQGIACCFPEVQTDRSRLVLGRWKGWSTDTLLCSKGLVFQAPISQEDHRSFEILRRLMPRLAPELPVAVPDFSYYASRCSTLGSPLAGYQRIDGQRLTKSFLRRQSVKAQRRIARDLGDFLSALHSFPIALARQLGVRNELPGRLMWLERCFSEYVAARLTAEQRARASRLLARSLRSVERTSQSLVLAHSDLVEGHIFIDRDRRLRGVIDWGNVTLAEPAAEVSNLLFCFGHDFVQSALRDHPERDEVIRRSQEIYVPTLSMIWLVYSVMNYDSDLYHKGLALMDSCPA